MGYPLQGLLDSGATDTAVNETGCRILVKLGLTLTSTRQTCYMANRNSSMCTGIIRTPFVLENRLTVINVLVIPTLSCTLILGSNFWISAGIIPNLRSDVWHFDDEHPSEFCEVTNHLSSLNSVERVLLDNFVQNNFTLMSDGLGYTNIVEHEISTDCAPIKQRYYPVSPIKQSIIDEELNKMLELDIIEPSNSGWSSPILLVPKKDGGYRFCVDFRQLNSVTKKDAYPIPYVSSILDRLRNAKYLSSLDIKSAYWQISVAESSREYTAFTIPGRGLFQFKRMPFGLTNAPATWQRLIDRVLGADLEPHVLVYLDDIVVLSETFETHLEILGKVFDRLYAAGLTVNKEKCKFCRSELRYLGYVVDGSGLRTDPEKIEAILNIPEPTNVHDIRRFIGMASWYRRFVPDFATIMKPLTELTRKSVKFKWTPECDEAFNKIKQLLISAPILTCPCFDQPFILQCDASAYGLGAVLTQKFDDGERVIAFLSRTLSRQEKNYTTTERELLSVIWATEKLRHYLEGTRFTVITDHHSLLWLNRLRDPTGRLARWAVRLQAFDYEIIHRKGKEHVVPDCLSRGVPITIDAIDSRHPYASTTDKWYKNMLLRLEENPQQYPQWRSLDGVLYKYVKCKIPELSDMSDNWKIVVPKEARLELLKQNHDDPTSGHVGIFKVYWKLRNQYTWPKMKYDVVRYVKSCNVCSQCKPEQKAPAGLMGNRPSINRPWQMISLDFIGPLPRSTRGYTHILVITDHFSKYVLLIPLRSATANALTRHIEEEVFLVYGVPQYLICDNGKQMVSNQFKSMCSRYNVRILFTSLYNPRADPTERTNRTVKTMLTCYIKEDQRKWDLHLSAIGCAIRSAKHETTGYTPFYVNFGREYTGSGNDYFSKFPSEPEKVTDMTKRMEGFRKMFEDVRNRIENAHRRDQQRYNLRRRPVEYNIGQRIWRKNKALSNAASFISAKLLPKYVGPFHIRKKHGYCSYELEDEFGRSKGVWHVQDLKPAEDDLTRISNATDSD